MDGFVKADKHRWSDHRFPYVIPQYRFLRIKRKCEYWRNRFLPFFIVYRFLFEHYKIKYGTDIPAKVQIGKGLRIEHLGGIVVNPKAKIGSNVTLLNGVLIGAQNRGKHKGFPVIGDYVWIGTNSIIVGSVHVGNNVLIAPGSYINFDVPDNSIVLGNPGKIIHKDNAVEGYITYPYEGD